MISTTWRRGRGFSHGILKISETADDIEHAGFFYGKLIQFLRHIITMSEDQVKCIRNSPAYCDFFPDWFTECDDYLYESRVVHELEYRVMRSAISADVDYELRASERNSWSWEQYLKLTSDPMSMTWLEIKCLRDDEIERVHSG